MSGRTEEATTADASPTSATNADVDLAARLKQLDAREQALKDR